MENLFVIVLICSRYLQICESDFCWAWCGSRSEYFSGLTKQWWSFLAKGITVPGLPKKRKVNQKGLIIKDWGLSLFFFFSYSPPHGHKQHFGALMLTEDIYISPEDVWRCSTTTTSGGCRSYVMTFCALLPHLIHLVPFLIVLCRVHCCTHLKSKDSQVGKKSCRSSGHL